MRSKVVKLVSDHPNLWPHSPLGYDNSGGDKPESVKNYIVSPFIIENVPSLSSLPNPQTLSEASSVSYLQLTFLKSSHVTVILRLNLIIK